MQSIITFKEDEQVQNEDKHKKVVGSTDKYNLVKKRKHSSSSDDVTEKKVKKEILKVNSVQIKKNKNDEHNDNNEKNTLIENLNSQLEKSESIVPIDDNKNETIIVSNNIDSNIKKKRKRNKGKKVKSDATINIPGLRIMSK